LATYSFSGTKRLDDGAETEDVETVIASYLAPDITQAILDGRQLRDLTAEKLLAHARLPLAWHKQRAPARLPQRNVTRG